MDRRPAAVAALVLAATVGLGFYAAMNLGVNADPNAMISADLPFRTREREFQHAFRSAADELLVLVEADSAFAAGQAADALATRLGERTDLFERVQLAGGGDFFRRNALLYLDLPELEALADRLAAVQPFLAEITRDASVVGVADLLAKAAQAQRDGHDVGMDLAAALDRVSIAVEAARQGRAAPDPWGDALIGGSRSEEARHRVIALRPNSKFNELLFAEPAVQAIRADAQAAGLSPERGVQVRITGSSVLNYEELQVVASQGKTLALVALVLFTLATFFAVRSLRVLVALVTSLVVSLIWSNAFAAATIGHLNQVSATFNVLIIGLGGELGIHFCMRYAELAAKGRSRTDALTETGATMGSALFSSTVTTAIGFLVFWPTDYRGVAELGLIAGAGVLFSLAATLTLLPALLSFGAKTHPYFAAPSLPFAARLGHVPVTHARPIRWAALAIAVGSLALIPRVRFDHNPVNLRDPNTESVQAFQDLLGQSSTSPWTVDLVAKDLATAQAKAAELAQLPFVSDARTLVDYVPDQQDEKRAMLETMAFLVPPPAPRSAPPDAAAQMAALGRLEAALGTGAGALGDRGDGRFAASEARLREALGSLRAAVAVAPDPNALLAPLQSNVVGSLVVQLDELVAGLSPDVVTLDTLPPELREMMLAEDGRARVTVIPKKDLNDSANLEEFVDGVYAVAPEGTGPAVGLIEWGRVTSGAMKQAMLVGFLATALFLFLLWRNWWDTALAFFPLGLAGLATCSALVLLGWHFDFANVIVLPMLLGMGIDNGVHLVHRHRTNPEEEDVLASSTARAVWFAALTTVLSFGSLAFASHRGMASLGRLLTLGVAATLVAYVVVLPAVLAWDDERAKKRESA